MPESPEPPKIVSRPSSSNRRAAAVPLYDQVRRQISELILLGEWPPGTVLPGEVDLAREFGVSVGTVRRALSDLTREGLLIRRRKTGTVVTGRTPHHTLSQFFQFFRLHRRDGSRLRSETIVVKTERRTVTEVERARLGLALGDPVIALDRLRCADGRVVMHESLVLPAVHLPDFPEEDVPELLYIFLLERYGIRIAAVRENIRAEGITDADRAILDLGHATAVLVIEEVAYDQSGRPMIVAWHRAVTDAFMYVNEVN